MTLPDTTEVEPGYNESGFLKSVRAKIRGAGSWTNFVTDINYGEKGQGNKITNSIITLLNATPASISDWP